jgi:hypothetical protein
MKRCAILLALVLTGCATHQVPPPSVQIMPNDCANRAMIIQWLSRQAAISRTPLQTQESYDQAQAQIRHRIWNMRYNCQPV